MKRILLIAALALVMCACGGASKADINRNYTKKEIAAMSADEIANLFVSYSEGLIEAYKNDDYKQAQRIYQKGERLDETLEQLLKTGQVSEKKLEQIWYKASERMSRYDDELASEINEWLEECEELY